MDTNYGRAGSDTDVLVASIEEAQRILSIYASAGPRRDQDELLSMLEFILCDPVVNRAVQVLKARSRLTVVDTEHHLIVTHGVINVGNDRGQLARMSKQAKEVLEVDKLEVVADRGYFDGEEIRACEEAGVAVTLPKPMTSNAKAEGRFGKQDFAYLPDEDVYRCPSGQLLPYHYTNIEHGMTLRRYWSTAARQGCAIKSQCTPAKERRITRWEHEHVVEEVQRRLDSNPDAMRTRRETVEHPFGTIKARMGATHFLMKRLRNVAAEMALHVLAYNLTRVMNILGKPSLIAAIRAA